MTTGRAAREHRGPTCRQVHSHRVGRAPTKDNLLAIYLPQRLAWQAAVNAMIETGFQPVPSYNPYWDVHGKTFEDPDGYRVVLAQMSWDR